MNSSEHGDMDSVQRNLQRMDPSSSIDRSGKTLLHLAAEMNNEIMTKYLIDAGCQIDAVDNRGDTPLILACQENYTDVIRVLVEAKASVLVSNNQGVSAAKIFLGDTRLNFHIMDLILERVKEECSNDSLQTAKALLQIGCSLTRVVRLKDTTITKYMLDNGCDVNYKDQLLQGWTPLHQALIFKDSANAKLLIDCGADVNVVDANGLTPVSCTCKYEMLLILLDKGARVVDDSGTLIAPDLFSYWEKEVVEMLIARFNLVDLSIKDKDGTTLFHHLASNESFDPVQILQNHYNYSIDINQIDTEGSTALYKAVKAGNVETVEFLLKTGAKVNIGDIWHDEANAATETFLNKSRVDQEKIMILLLQYGADIQWTFTDHQDTVYFILDFVLRDNHFAMAKIILARLALIEELGVQIKDVYWDKIEHTAVCKKYFEFCKRTIGKLKRTVIQRRVTLFDFMTCSEETLVRFARSEEFVQTVRSMMYTKRNSHLYYYKVLRKRVKKVVEIVDLRKNFSLFINSSIPELQNNRIVIEKIVEYIIYDILCFLARDPTFKCTVSNE